jgi:hypothetical protein
LNESRRCGNKADRRKSGGEKKASTHIWFTRHIRLEHRCVTTLRLEERNSPQQILKRRYAAGEIEKNDYNRRLEELGKNRNAA